MFDKILIANRGEIAVRVVRACRELGIETVAVYSEADRYALHTQLADEAVCIGPAESKDSYLNMSAILAACEVTGAQAVHPGFGFLSENAYFQRTCEKCGITFIGPDGASIEQMGDKAKAKDTMKKAGVPVIPGSDGTVSSLEAAEEVCQRIGYPVMIKASAGGGGRGIRKVNCKEELENSYRLAKEEALRFFADDDVYIEKFIVNPRHVEVQILGDRFGNMVYLGERDCSMQKRNQKVLEETPSPAVDCVLRQKLGETAVRGAKACGYYNVGTIEFLLDENGQFYFMEMNTRIQVEHPITEQVTGVDLVKEQIKIAAGLPLTLKQEDIAINGHAIECRINAEDPKKNFRPSPGTVEALHLPGGNGIRIDSAVYQGYTIPPHYDNMIAKLICHAKTREEAVAKMEGALTEFVVEGIDTNIDFELNIIRDPGFVAGKYDNGYLARHDLT